VDMMSSDVGSNSRRMPSRMTSRVAGSTPLIGSSSRYTRARRDMMRLIWSFSPMPLLISARRRSVGSVKKSIIEAALSASKSLKNVE
jgi:hypothetical protein